MSDVRSKVRVGAVDSLRYFDLGMVLKFSPTVKDEVRDGKRKRRYVISGWFEDKTVDISLLMIMPETVLQSYIYPSIVIRRSEVTPVMERFHPMMLSYRAPADDSTPLVLGGKAGHSAYVAKRLALPIDITYEVETHSRFMNAQGIVMFRNVMKLFSLVGQTGYIDVTDALGAARTYGTIIEGIADNSEVTDLSERVVGMTVTLRILAELDLSGEYDQDKIILAEELDVLNMSDKP